MRTRSTTAVVATTAMLFVALAACSSENRAPSTPPPISASASTTVPATTVVMSTTTSSTTTTVTAATTTTIAPTTTLPATTTTVPVEDTIRQALMAFSAASIACTTDPTTCDPTTFTAEQGPGRANSIAYYQSLAKAGLHGAVDRRGSYLVVETVSLVSGTEATVVACGYDAGTMLGPPGPDGQPTVVNDEIASVRATYTVYLEGESWRVGQVETEDLGSGNLCPAKG